MRFAKDFPDKLKANILTSEVVGKKVALKNRGKDFLGLCPFHNEKTPSFTVNDQKGFYHCFGCGAHGDIFSFVMEKEHLSYKEAVIKLAEDYGITIDEVVSDKKGEMEFYNQLEIDYQILERTCRIFEENLVNSSGVQALKYLKNRGISNENIKQFRLGFAIDDYNFLHKNLLAAGFLQKDLLRTGIIGLNDNGKLYDKFRNRIIFPIFDKKGRVIAFGGRIINEGFPKYLNSSETEIFKKNRTLYNYHLARKTIFEKGYCVVVEGYMDTISLFDKNIKNVVAGLGTALSINHLQELFYITDKIVMCLDGDFAGLKAAQRVIDIALPIINAKKNINFAFLPKGLDPDDFVKQFGAEELEKLFVKSNSFSEAMLKFVINDLNIDSDNVKAEEKAKIEMLLLKKLELLKDQVLKKYFASYFKEQLFFLGKKGKKSVSFNNDLVKTNHGRVSNIESLGDIFARNIIAMIIAFPDFASYEDEGFNIKDVNFFNERLTILKDEVVELLEEDDYVKEELLEKLSQSHEKQDIVAIKNFLAICKTLDNNKAVLNLRILLLKELLFRVDFEYRQCLSDIDNIETQQTTITNQKINELFNYKTSLEKQVFDLEQEL